MDYKKEYEQLTKFIKDLYPFMSDYCKEKTEGIFSELKESEDERVRKDLISYFEVCGNRTFARHRVSNIIAWLEKQGGKNEQNFWEKCNHCEYFDGYDICLHKKNFGTVTDETKENCKNNKFFIEKQGEKANENNEEIPLSEQNPADKVEPKFKVGDWIIGNTIYKVLCVIDDEYRLSLNIDDIIVCAKIKTIDKNFHLWTIQDAKDGDVLANKSGAIFINAGSSNERVTLDCYCYLSLQNEFCIEEHKTGSWFYKEYITPATKEQRDLLFSKMKEAGYEWDVEKKELKKIEQEQTELPNGEDFGIDSLYHAARILEKTLGEVVGYQSDDGILEHKCAIEAVNRLYKQRPAWSEEDENELEQLLDILHKNGYESFDNWLKSLKERYTWKPSDEQIEALLKLEEMHVLEHEKTQENAHLYMAVKSIREQLLKLKGE